MMTLHHCWCCVAYNLFRRTVKNGIGQHSTAYRSIDNVWSYFIHSHWFQASLPNFQLKLLSKDELHWLLILAVVINDSLVIITETCLIAKCYLQSNTHRHNRLTYTKSVPDWPIIPNSKPNTTKYWPSGEGVLCGMQIAECRISKRFILWNFTCKKSFRNKGYFVELKLQKMFLLLSYVNWISVQFYRALNHHAHKPHCVLQEERVG